MTADRLGVADAPPEMQGPSADSPTAVTIAAAVAAHQRPIVGALDIPRSDPAVSSSELEDLVQGLANRLSSSLPPDAGPLEVDRRRLVEALRCPARTEAEPEGPFEWSAVKAHRRLGLRALRAMHRSGQQYPDALEGAARAIDLEIDEGTRLGEWLARLSPAGRSAVLAAASGFASAALDRPAVGPLQASPVRIPSTSGVLARARRAGEPGSPSRRDDLRLGPARGRAGHRLDGSNPTRGAALRHPRLVRPSHAGAATRHLGGSRGRAAELGGRRRSPARGRRRGPRSGSEGPHGPDERRGAPRAPRVGVPSLPRPGPLRPRQRLGGGTDPPGRRHSGGDTASDGVFETGLTAEAWHDPAHDRTREAGHLEAITR